MSVQGRAVTQAPRPGGSSIGKAFVPMASPAYPESSAVTVLSPPTPTPMDTSFSPYFSQERPPRRENKVSNWSDCYVIEDNTVDTPGPGYTTFANHLEELEGASTPLIKAPAKDTATSTPVAKLQALLARRLEFGKSGTQQHETQESTPPPPKRPKREERSASVELRVKPGEATLLAQSVLQSQPVPNNGAAKRPRQRRTPASRAATQNPPSWSKHPVTEEIIITNPQVSGEPGLKQIKLRDNCTTGEIVDYLLHGDTFSWDILRDEATQHYRFVFHQNMHASE